MPRLTCITTTFNDGPALLGSVRSVLNQSFGDFQYIVVDDGSAPEAQAVLAGIDDKRLMVVPQANDGVSSARNRALELATGEYVTFLDADDARPPWSFAAIDALITAQAPDVILCRGVLSEVRGDLLPFYDSAVFDRLAVLTGGRPADLDDPAARMARRLAHLTEPQPANKVVRRALVGRGAARFPDTHVFEDIHFHTTVLSMAQRLSVLDQPAFAYFRRYQRPQITSATGDQRFGILAVMRLALDGFARRGAMEDALWRASALAGCLHLAAWCRDSIAHPWRRGFEDALRAVLRMIDPRFLELPAQVPEGFDRVLAAHRFLRGLGHA